MRALPQVTGHIRKHLRASDPVGSKRSSVGSNPTRGTLLTCGNARSVPTGGQICPHEIHHGDVASIERRVRGDGTVAFRVVWRDPTQPGRQSLTFDDRRQAERTIKLLDANGQRLTLAVEVANAIRRGGPTVEDVVREHIELLNRVGEDTRTGYRLRARDHITPHLGALPVRALTWQQVTLWIRELQMKGLS